MENKIFGPVYKNIAGTLTIDPGDHTGWAYWDLSLRPVVGSFTYASEFKKLGKPWQIYSLAENFGNMIRDNYADGLRIKQVVIEEVSVWENSLKSMAAAKRGDLFKLAMVIGGYIHRCGMLNLPVKLVKPNDWKGQLPDDAVARRVTAINGQQYPNPHIYSAVGIGLNEAGIFKDMGVKSGR